MRKTILRIGFWAALTALLGAVGYVASAFLGAVPVFDKRGLQRWLRRFFLANGLVIPLFCIAYFHPGYSATQLLFGVPWAVTVPGSLLLLTLYFRRPAE